MSWDIEAFRERIEAQHQFPGDYSFKFIVPRDKKEDVLSILPQSELSFKESSNGKYVSVTAVARMDNSQAVLDVYLSAHRIPGCMSL